MVHKIFLIFWKNLLMRKNHYIATSFEVVLPIGLIILTNLYVPKVENEVDNDSFAFETFKDKQCVLRHSSYAYPSYGNVIYEPSTPFIDLLMSKAACYAGYKKSSVKPGNLSDSSIFFSLGVKFSNISDDSSAIPKILNYTLFPTNKAWTNLLTMWRFSGSAIPKFGVPTFFSVVEFQRSIDTSYLHLKNISTKMLNVQNTNAYDKTPRVYSLAIYFSLFVAFSLMVPPIVSRIVQEKFTGSKELMLMMGIERQELWVARFMDVFLFITITVSGMILFLYVPLKEKSSYLKIPLLIFWSVIMYGLISVIFFLFFMSCFFEKSTLAVYITEIIWCVSFILSSFISTIIELPLFAKYLMCLFPQISLMEGVSILLDFDFYGKTIKLTERLSGKDDSLSLLNVLLIMTFYILFYGTLTWYLDQIKPGRYGVPQPYNFCFRKSYWSPNKVITSYNNTFLNDSRGNFESVPSNLQVGVSIQKVSKVYKSIDKGIVTAVDNVSLDFYHGEISALLGHNGAGKTTIFSMITGLSYPTSGKIIINGYDLGVNVREARRSLGLCPQQDMLFSDLQTIQILKFYGVIKGMTLKDAEKEALELISKLKLNDVKNTQTCNLSGGQRRKVSLAIALIGGSEVLVLDEPTSGMDPEIRREIWEILLGFRGARTIILTTHFMEEADALCDRIAIMDHGRIKCCGSPMFLKSKYGKGYVLNIVVLDTNKSKELVEYVKQFISSAKFKSQNIRTLSFEIPENKVAAFPALLSGLEDKQAKNEITSYCINLSTLEDVFLRLGSNHEVTDGFAITDSPSYKKLEMSENLSIPKVSGYLLYLFQFWALIQKKWIFFQRCYKSFLMYCILSAVIVVPSVWIFQNRSHHTSHATNLRNQKSLTYSLGLYPSSLILYSNLQDDYKKELFGNLVHSFGCDIEEVNDVKNALHEIFMSDFYTYAKKVVLAVDFSSSEIRIFHNEDAVHMVPISLNLIHNFLLKYWFKNDTIVTSVDVRFANKDSFVLPQSTPKCIVNEIPDFSGIQTFFYLLGPVKENLYGAKELQLMIITASFYWFSHIIFDSISFFVYIVVIYVGLGFSFNDVFMLQHAGIILTGFLFWGSGLILFNYLIAALFKDLTTAFSVAVMIYVTFCFIIYNFISLGGLPNVLQYLHPSCILKFGLTDLCAGKQSNFLLALVIYNCVLFATVSLIDSKLLSRIAHRLPNQFLNVNYSLDELKDDFVKKEEEMVKSLISKGNISTSALIVHELKRWYLKSFRFSPAVRGISFAVNRGECFGLLGVNGAGKTSTFKMLTGSLLPSHGSAYACSERLPFFNRQKFLLSIGYCPQAGGLIPSLKGRELLALFAQLRGVHRSCLYEEVLKWLEKLNLLEYANLNCGSYSGGNQRKLCMAISLIGDCPLIFLDEPTSGVDPLSRRSIWNVVEGIQNEGRSVVLTSHSLDECEALCTRLAIMVNGRFRCIGETTFLKDRFGQGHCVQLKLSNGAPDDKVQSLKKAVATTFEPGCELVDEHFTILQYHVTNKCITWADLFTKLNALKENFDVLESYAASATTLEQIFIYFARNR